MSEAAPDQSTDAGGTPAEDGGAPFKIPEYLKRGDIALALGVIAIVISIYRARGRGILTPIVTSTMTVTAMIFATILTASVFSLVFRGLGGDVRVEEILHAMPGGPQGALIFVMALIFILGFFLEFFEININR